LLIAGDGPVAASLPALVAESRLRNVQLLGPRHDLPRLYHQATVFVLPSLSEGCSNALLEAMASGLCPVVTDIGGNRALVTDHVNGRLVEADNDRDLGAALGEVLSNAALRRQLAAAAREHVVSHHEINTVSDRYLQELVRWVD
jgi:L-malate glycosyltransferase